MKQRPMILAVVMTSALLACLAEETMPASVPGQLGRLLHPFSDGDHPVFRKGKVQVDAILPRLPETVMVYKVVNPNITESWVRDFARKQFQMEGRLRRSGTGRLIFLQDTKWRLEVDTTDGSYFLESLEFLKTEFKDCGDFRDGEACKAKAVAFLSKYDLLPETAYLRGVVDNTAGAQVMSVGFGRQIDSSLVVGAGAGIVVDIGRGGEVAWLFKAWQQIRPWLKFPIIRPSEAVTELEDGRGVWHRGTPPAKKITKVTLAYYSSPVKQDYLQPCYLFEGVDEKGEKSSALVSAIKQTYLVPLDKSKRIRKESGQKVHPRAQPPSR